MSFDAFDFEENGAEQGQKLDLSRYITALRRRWWLILLVSITVAVPWAFYVKQEKPIYEATVSIRFRELKGNPKVILQDIFEQLTSRRFAEQSVQDMGLVVSIEQNEDDGKFIARNEVFSSFTSTSAPVTGTYVLRLADGDKVELSMLDGDGESEYPVRTFDFFRAREDTISVNGFSFKLADLRSLPTEVKFNISPFRSAVQSLQGRIAIDLNSAWTLMFLTLQDNDPYVVTHTANSLAERFIKVSIDTDEGVEATQLHTLQARLERAKQDYDDIDKQLTSAKLHTGITGGREVYQRRIAERDGAQRRLENAIEQRDALKQLVQRLKTPAEGREGESGSKRYIYNAIANSKIFDNDATMIVNRQQLGDLDRRLGDEISLKTEQHPDVIDLKNQIKSMYQQILETANVKLASLNQEISTRQTEVVRLSAQIDRIPVQESTVTELQREWDQKSNYYQELLAKVQEAKIAKEVAKPAIEILDPAIKPEYPTNRNKKAKAAAGGVVGLFLGIGLVFLLEMMDKTIKTVEDLRGNLNHRVLGSIPHINFGEHYEFQDHEKAKMIDQQLVTHDYSPTPIGEAYRSLRTNILFSKSVGRVQSFVITSMAPGDGKSFTAANLSITMAQQKSNTLLVDTDLRRGVLHNTFGLPKEPGFSNYLTAASLPSEIINETHIPNLSLISCGSMIPNPSEMLGSVQLKRFLDEMRRRYDLIIFDTPPLNAATDAVVLGTQVDGAVIVVRASKTKKDVARQKMELFENVQAKVLGIILNGTSVDLAHEGYSYYHY